MLTRLAREEGSDAPDRLKRYLTQHLDNVSVKDEHLVRRNPSYFNTSYLNRLQGYIHFHVQSPATPWSRLFSVMEAARTEVSSLFWTTGAIVCRWAGWRNTQ